MIRAIRVCGEWGFTFLVFMNVKYKQSINRYGDTMNPDIYRQITSNG